MLFLGKPVGDDAIPAKQDAGWWWDMFVSDLIGKDGSDVPGTAAQKNQYTLVMGIICAILAVVTAPTDIGGIVFGLIAFRKLWIVLHKAGIIPFG